MKYNKDNIFAKIIAGEIPCDKIYEDEQILAFNDISKLAPVHVLVIPKNNYISFDDFVLNAPSEFISTFFKTVRKIANDLNIGDTGYRIITNNGKNASQTVFHYHVHILGGRDLGNLLPN